ncbi:helix-turn-helix domain-containing protein [Selenomonas artemidis]|uniref:helix-turn-helix domain-containing protein n=1 Tax=Selenomonas artemidis TaxID=671224 RepID=UPI00288A40DB|nr:helix-turn-helix transcriptional regulator [Selenomonas artemidis]
MIERRIKELRLSNGLTQKDLSDYLGLTPKMVSFYELGQRVPPSDIILKLAEKFHVSTDYLLGNAIKPKQDLPPLNRKDEREITKLMDDMKETLMQEKGLMFDGQPASEESIQSILDAMQIGMEMAKKRNKAKYTPKKYRHED